MQLLRSAPATPSEAESVARACAAPWFDWLVGLLSCWLTGGLFLDGWAHNHLGSMETFFTPWHGVLYSGFAAIAATLGLAWLRGVHNRRPLIAAVPDGYELSALGVLLFALAGVLDLLWHTRFGIEAGTDALLSPTHLLLAASGILIVTGPLRAAWRRPQARLGWRTGAPAIAAATLTLAGLGFFTQFAHPFVTAYASTGNSTSWGRASNLRGRSRRQPPDPTHALGGVEPHLVARRQPDRLRLGHGRLIADLDNPPGRRWKGPADRRSRRPLGAGLVA